MNASCSSETVLEVGIPTAASSAAVGEWASGDRDGKALTDVWRALAVLRFTAGWVSYWLGTVAVTSYAPSRDHADLVLFLDFLTDLLLPSPVWLIVGCICSIVVLVVDLWWLTPLSQRRYGFRVVGDVCELRMGVLFQSVRYIPLSSIQQVEIFSSPIERFYNLARLFVYTPGYDDAVSVVWGVNRDSAERLRSHLLRGAERFNDELTPSSSQFAG